MSKYSEIFEIPHYDTDKHRKATPMAMIKYLGETSGAHTNSIGFGIDKMQELKCAWILNRWKVQIDRYPNLKEKIRIETWSSGIDRFYATREFVIYDEEGMAIGKASTLWIYINVEKKRPIRIPEEIIGMISSVEEKNFEDFYDFKSEVKIEEYIDFHVRRSDIDYNNHVNNAKYLSWMLETIPEDVYEDYMLKEFEILYKKETIYGQTILAGSKELVEEEGLKTYFHDILDNESKELHSMGITKWMKK